MLYFFLFVSLFFITALTLLFLILQYIKIRKADLLNSVTNFTFYVALLSYHMDRAYEIIYKEKIMIYSIEGLKLDGKQFEEASRAFVILVMKMIGQNVKDSLMTLYGNEETVIFNLLEYFNNKFEHDEIYKASMDNIMSEDLNKDENNRGIPFQFK